eukprot:IDg22612t1
MGGHVFHSPVRFFKLGLFQNTPELFAYAPWFHLAVGRKSGMLSRYLNDNGEFSGGLGLTEPTVSRKSFLREVCVAATGFESSLLPRAPEQFGRALYLVWYFFNRRGWASVLPTGEPLPEAVDAWRLRFEAEAPYVRDLLRHRFPAVPHGEPWDLEFDVRFLVLDTQIRHEFRFTHSDG